MDTIIGLCGKDFMMIASDSYCQFSLYRMKHDEDKVLQINDNKLLASTGPIGDRNQFTEYIRKNIHLHYYRTGEKLSPNGAANFTRNQLSEFLRRNPYQCDCIIGGYDYGSSSYSMYWIDYLSSMIKCNKAAHGYGAYFVYSIMDNYHKHVSECNLEEGMDLIRRCIDELGKRFLICQNDFMVKIVSEDGIRTVSINNPNKAGPNEMY